MKTVFWIMLFITLPLGAQDTPLSAFSIKWENSKNYLLEIAEAMPEKKYDFKPSERQMTFKEQLLHIQANIHWLGTTYFGMNPIDKVEENAGKAELIHYLETTFITLGDTIKSVQSDALKEEVSFFAGPKTKLQILNLLQDHVTHHRGQIIVYLNLNDITPPRYSGW